MVVEIFICYIKEENRQQALLDMAEYQHFKEKIPGHIRSYFKQSCSEPHTFLVYSEFESKESYENYMQSFKEKTGGVPPLALLLEKPPIWGLFE
ncbi:MAG TPA: antibiotic biosynthesis monooxygenase [candidate division Zixibacteria bacterium]